MTTTPDTSREAVERKAKSLRWQRSEFNADDHEALDAAAALLALLERAEAAERERDEAREKCMGCLTDDEKTESINELAAALAAEREKREAAEASEQEALALADARCQEKAFVEDTLATAERERDAANSLIQEIGMILGSTDEWSDQENMIADVRQRVNDALAALRTAEGALDEIEISDADADGIFWLKIRLPSGSGGAVNLGNEKRIVAQVGMRFEEERRAALAEIRKALEGK